MVLRLLLATSVLLLSLSTVAAADGAAVYKAQCAKCHGETGAADTPVGKAMKAPALTGDAKVKDATDADLAALIKKAAKHPPAVKALSDDDLKAAAAHAKQLAGK